MPEHPRIEELRRRVQRDPASIAFAQLAEEHRRAGQYDDAVAVCRNGLAVHPGYLSARVTLARTLVEIDRLPEAREEFQTVLNAAPDNLAALRGLAEVLHRQGTLADALALYRRALGLAPNDPDLERIVSDLAREVAQVLPDPTDGLLTLDELERELERQIGMPARAVVEPRMTSNLPPVEAAIPAPSHFAPTDNGLTHVDPGRESDLQTLATLERWMVAIHGARAESRA